MGVVGSLPSLPSPPSPPSPLPPLSTLTDTTEIGHEESTALTGIHSYHDLMINEINSNTNPSFNSSINKDNISDDRNCSKRKNPVTIVSDPINRKVRSSTAPTLETGRRSKFAKLEGDAARKRDLRRKRNRDAAKKLKAKREIMEEGFNKQISDLESKEKDLLTAIESLKTYKEYLESQCRRVVSEQEELARSRSSTLQQIELNRQRVQQSVSIHHVNTHIKKEPRSPTPQWQLFFSI